MRPAKGLACTVVFGVAAYGASAADYTVERSLEVATSPQDAWNMVGDFCDIDDWHPAVSACRLKVMDGALHRVLTLVDGGQFVEKRIAVEPGVSYTYSIVSSPLALDRYTSTLSIAAGGTPTITWSSRFTSDDPGTEKAVIGIYEAGLAEIETRLAQ